MQISASTSAMPSQAMNNSLGNASNGQSGGGSTSCCSSQSNQSSSPLGDMMQTGKELGAALMMSVLFGKDANDEDSKKSDTMAMMLMAAGAGGGNSYTAMGSMQQSSSVGQSLNVTA